MQLAKPTTASSSEASNVHKLTLSGPTHRLHELQLLKLWLLHRRRDSIDSEFQEGSMAGHSRGMHCLVSVVVVDFHKVEELICNILPSM